MMTKNETEYPQLTPEQTCDVLCRMAQTRHRAVILFHARPDGDAVGSALALRALLEAFGMEVRCICADEIPGRLAFMQPAAQESVLPAALPAGFDDDCAVISVDTASPAQMGSLAENWLGRVELMIDHHATGTPYAPAYVDPTAAATGEMIFSLAQMLEARGCIGPLPLAAMTALYAAISSDTGSFRYTNVTERTFSVAASLRRAGVDTAAVSRALFECKPLLQLTAEHLGFSVMQFWEQGRVAVIPFSYEMKTAHGIPDDQLETLTDVARQIEGVEIVLVVKQPQNEGVFRISSRSSGDFCVAPLCARFGGGGHAKAAGCTVVANDMTAALEQLRAALLAEFSAQDLL